MERVKTYGLIFITMNILGLSIALFLNIGLGADSIGLLSDGIHRQFSISFGTASLAYNSIIIIISLFFAKSKLGFGTIVYAAFTGYFTDFYFMFLKEIDMESLHLLVRLLIFMVAQCGLSLGLSMLIQCKLGMSALDALLKKLEEKSRIPYPILKTSTDFCYVVIGILCGGVFGIGTIISVCTTGYLISLFTHRIAKLNLRMNRQVRE